MNQPSASDDLDQINFAENPEPRCACVLLVDDSRSMKKRQKIQQLNAGLQEFRKELLGDELATKRVEVAVARFGPPERVQDFCAPSELNLSPFEADCDCTPLGAATKLAIQMVRERVALYKRSGVPYYRPWIVLITDGESTDDVEEAGAEVRALEEDKRVAFFAIAVDSGDMETLAKLSSRSPARLNGHKFREFFLWLSASMKSVSRSTPGSTSPLPPIDGWTEV